MRQPHPPVLRGQSNISLSERYEMAKSVHPYAVPRPAGSTEGLSSILGSVTDLVLTNDTVGFARRNSYDVPKPASTIPTELDNTSNMYIYINGGTSTEKTYSNMGDLHRAEVIRILAKYTSLVPLLICIVIVIVYLLHLQSFEESLNDIVTISRSSVYYQHLLVKVIISIIRLCYV